MANTPTKAEIEAENARIATENDALRAEIEALKKAAAENPAAPKPHPTTPPEPGMVEQVVYVSNFRSNVVNFPFREGQGPQTFGSRPPVAEFQPLGGVGLYKTQDPDEIKYLDAFSRNFPHVRPQTREWVFPDGFKAAAPAVELPDDLANAIEKNTRVRIPASDEGEPV